MTSIAHENNATTLAIELGDTPTGTWVHLVHSGYRASDAAIAGACSR
jgi:hypothetical protein